MPFTKLVDNHSCPTPTTREDGSQLVIGDEWRCDSELTDGTGRKCEKVFRWTSAQMEGLFWMPVTRR